MKCPECRIFLLGSHIPDGHHRTDECCDGERKNKWRKTNVWTMKKVQLYVEGQPIENVDKFKYLGLWMSASNDNWGEVATNVMKARSRWGQIQWVLVQDKATVRTMV